MKLVVAFGLTGLLILSCVTQLPHEQVICAEVPTLLDAPLVDQEAADTTNAVSKPAAEHHRFMASSKNPF